MKNNKYLMAARAVSQKLTDNGFLTKIFNEEPQLLANMISFEMFTTNTDNDFFNVSVPTIFSTIKENGSFNISYLTHSIKGNGYWILYLILKDTEETNEIQSEIKSHLSNSEKLKELYIQSNKAIENQKTRRKSCKNCESIINLDAFFKNRKFKYKKDNEAMKCPVCESDTGLYSKTINERINKLGI